MSDDAAFLASAAGAPDDDAPRLAYADWLDERADPRGPFLRAHLAVRRLPPDHPARPAGEHELSRLRRHLDPSWLSVAEPERAHLSGILTERPACHCLDAGYSDRRWPQTRFHLEPQDTESPAWRKLLGLIDEAAGDRRSEFAPLQPMTADERARIVTLPPSIGKLTAVRQLLLYGSSLVRLPPETGDMTALEQFKPYTSYRLHWFPFEITRCPALRRSTVSTRALYGNYKYRPPFPRLGPLATPDGRRSGAADAPRPPPATRPCSVCRRPFEDRQAYRVWVSAAVATDVLPLLVNACSAECVGRLPAPPDGYVPGPHRGEVNLNQPPPR